MRVLLQVKPAPEIVASVIDPRRSPDPADVVGPVPGVVLDPAFPPVALPAPFPASAEGDPLSLNQPLTYSLDPAVASVVVRGELPDDDLATRTALLTAARPDIVGVFADPVISTTLTCGGDGARGTWLEVERLLHATDLRAEGYDGAGVALAVVDTGINAERLSALLDRTLEVDANRSWTPPGVNVAPGRFPVDHGTMCAFDALIGAPRATLLDLPVLRSRRAGQTALDGLLSDAVAAYAHLRTVLEAMPADRRALVVTNSWGSFSPRWDFPVGHPGNYSDNAAHPFNLIVGSLAEAGADILFAAGNCGQECPDGRCAYPNRPIGGANSHPQALSVGGVDVHGERVGYSSQGPGRLWVRKPDLCSYTHFSGSQVYGPDAPDSGTSAACPVAAGVVAAVRARVSAGTLDPSQLRTLLRRTADDRSGVGFDYDYGYGILDPMGVLGGLRRRAARPPATRAVRR
jgi:subtilisin family serine protease